MIRFRCPSCEAKMEVDDAFAGRAARCATCGEDLKVPRQSEVTPRRPAAPVRPGAATVKIEGEKVEIVAPVETTAYVALGVLAFAILLFITVLIVAWSTNLMPPLISSTAFGAVFSAVAAMMGLSAWNTINRSRGRKRGGKLANTAIMAGGGLCVLFLVGFVIGLAQYHFRQPCEKNLEMIYAALKSYAAKHDGSLPSDPPGLKGLLADGDLANGDWLTCPDRRALPGTVNYLYVPDITLNPTYKTLFPGTMMVVYDSDPHPDGLFRVLLLDGTIVTKTAAEWQKYLDLQQKQWQDSQKEIRYRKGLVPRPPPPAPTPTAPAAMEDEPPAPETPAPATKGAPVVVPIPSASAPKTAPVVVPIPTVTAPKATATAVPGVK